MRSSIFKLPPTPFPEDHNVSQSMPCQLLKHVEGQHFMDACMDLLYQFTNRENISTLFNHLRYISHVCKQQEDMYQDLYIELIEQGQALTGGALQALQQDGQTRLNAMLAKVVFLSSMAERVLLPLASFVPALGLVDRKFSVQLDTEGVQSALDPSIVIVKLEDRTMTVLTESDATTMISTVPLRWLLLQRSGYANQYIDIVKQIIVNVPVLLSLRQSVDRVGNTAVRNAVMEQVGALFDIDPTRTNDLRRKLLQDLDAFVAYNDATRTPGRSRVSYLLSHTNPNDVEQAAAFNREFRRQFPNVNYARTLREAQAEYALLHALDVVAERGSTRNVRS